MVKRSSRWASMSRMCDVVLPSGTSLAPTVGAYNLNVPRLRHVVRAATDRPDHPLAAGAADRSPIVGHQGHADPAIALRDAGVRIG